MEKLNLLVIVSFLLSIFVIASVSAADLTLTATNVTVVTPLAGGNFTGNHSVVNASFNCSMDWSAEDIANSSWAYALQNWTAIKIYLQSASLSGNTTVVDITNTTGAATLNISDATNPNNAWIKNSTIVDFNGTIDSSIFDDATDYTFTCSLYNGSDYVNKTRTSITIDNGVPPTPTLSPSSNTLVTSETTQTFTATVTDVNVTSCTYVIGRGGTDLASADTTSGSGTYSTTSCTFTKTFSDQGDNGDWWWDVTASDGTNTTKSVLNILQVQIAPSGGGVSPITIAKEKANIIMWVVIILVIGFVLYVIFKRR